MNRYESKQSRFARRKRHIRKSVYGTKDAYRMTVTRSLKHVYAQIIDDDEGKTLVAASTLDKDVRGMIKPEMKKSDISKLVGETIAKRAIAADIKKVVFDRNGFLFHGRVKALADAARKAGLEF